MAEEPLRETLFSLEERFTELCRGIGHTNPKYVFDFIQKLHTRPGRYHHNLELLRRSLNEFYEAVHLAENPAAVEVALFFKDLIFEHYLNDNKQRSARYALHYLKGMGVERDLAYYVFDLVFVADPNNRYSGDRKHRPCTIDQKIVADIDSSALGLSPEAYAQYEDNIKREYFANANSRISERDFQTQRIIFLQGFLDVPNIFLTEFFRKKYEKQAQENVTGKVTELKEQLGYED
ncbi:hypothetical protein KY343_00515 [Candidatus Woesearchaeota archaeon]|nr:hypothetical protein [Candidatus Woesearchaeota archaeon]